MAVAKPLLPLGRTPDDLSRRLQGFGGDAANSTVVAVRPRARER